MLNSHKFGRFGLKDLNTSEERRRKRFNEKLKAQKLSRTKSWFKRRNNEAEDIVNEIPPPEPEPMDVLDQIVGEIEMMDVNNNSSVLHTSIQSSWIRDLQDSTAQRQWTIVSKFLALIQTRPHPTLEDCVTLGLFGRFFELLKTCVVPRVQQNVAIILCAMSDCKIPITDQLPVDTIEGVVSVFKSAYHLPTKMALIEFMGNICINQNRRVILDSEFWTLMIELVSSYKFDSDSKEIRQLFNLSTYCFRMCCTSLIDLPNVDRASMALPIIAGMMRATKDRYILKNCVLALISFSLFKNRTVLDLNIKDKLVEFLDVPKYGTRVVYETVRVVGNILYGEDDERQEMIDAGVMPKLHTLMYDKNEFIKARASWAISNICVGTQRQLDLLFVNNLYRDMIKQFVEGSEDVQYEFAHGINCSLSKKRASKQQLEQILALDVIGVLCDALKTITELETLVIVIGTLRRLVRFNETILRKVCNRIGELDIYFGDLHKLIRIYNVCMYAF